MTRKKIMNIPALFRKTDFVTRETLKTDGGARLPGQLSHAPHLHLTLAASSSDNRLLFWFESQPKLNFFFDRIKVKLDILCNPIV